MNTPDILRWWAEQFRTRTNEFYTSHVLVADLNHGADEIEGLESENAKLRELLKDMRACLEDECKRCHEWGDICDLEHQMRELGIEVDE